MAVRAAGVLRRASGQSSFQVRDQTERERVKFDAGDVDMGEADALTSESLSSEMV